MTFNRRDSLRRCLDALSAQTLSRELFEVIVVDSSDLPQPDLAEDYSRRLKLRYCHGSNLGPAGNRNTGAELARTPLLAFCDDDCMARSDWLEKIRSAAIAHPNHLIGGGVENPAPENVYAAAGQAITEAVDAFYNPVGKAPRFFPGLNFALERDRYRTIGGFDREFGRLAAEDRDFVDRWRMAGGRLMACPQAIVRHEHRSSLSGFVRQVFNYGRGAWRYHSLRRMRNSGSMSEDISINFQLARYFRNTLRGQPPFRRIGIIILLGVWQVANLAGFVWQASIELRINNKS